MDIDRKQVNEDDDQLTMSMNGMTIEDQPTDGESHLMNLPDDCKLAIFYKLDHNDLDGLSTLCKNTCILSKYARSKALKTAAAQICVSELHSTKKFHLEMEFHKGDAMRNIDTKVNNLHQLMDNEANINHLTYILNRYAFKTFFINWARIDDDFVAFLDRVSLTHKSDCICFSSCKLSGDLSSQGSERFRALLLRAKPSELKLVFNSTLIDLAFLRKFRDAETVPFLAEFRGKDQPKVFADETFADTLSRYDGLNMTHLIVSPRVLTFAIMNRLRRKREGCWQITLTGSLNREQIEGTLESDFEYFPSNRGIRRLRRLGDTRIVYEHGIRLIGTDHETWFLCWKRTDEQTMWRVEAHF